MKERITVVLPTAGYGSRFEAPYPKELHALAPGVTLLDRCLSPVLEIAKTGVDVRLAVVIGEHKVETIRYLDRYKSVFKIFFTFQLTSSRSNLGGGCSSSN